MEAVDRIYEKLPAFEDIFDDESFYTFAAVFTVVSILLAFLAYFRLLYKTRFISHLSFTARVETLSCCRMAVVAEPLEQRAGLLASLTLSAAPLTLAFRERLPGSHPALGVSKAVPRAVRQERQDARTST